MPLVGGAAQLCGDMASMGGFQHRMALAGTRALWAYAGASNTEYHFDLFTLAEALDAVLCRATSPVS